MKESTKDFLWERLTSRKLHVTLVGFVSATLFFYHGMLPPDQWVSFVQWIFAIYVAGNAFEHFANQGIKLGQPKPKTKSRLSQHKDEYKNEE